MRCCFTGTYNKYMEIGCQSIERNIEGISNCGIGVGCLFVFVVVFHVYLISCSPCFFNGEVLKMNDIDFHCH